MKRKHSYRHIVLFSIAVIACGVGVIPETVRADTIIIANDNGEVFARDEYDLSGQLPDGYVNAGVGATALAANDAGEICMGFANGYASVRSVDNLTVSLTSHTFTAGAAISDAATRADGVFIIGTADDTAYVRSNTNLGATPVGYIGSDGMSFGGDVLVAGTPQGEIALSNTVGWRLYLREGNDLTSTPPGFFGDGTTLTGVISALATLSTGDIVVGTTSGRVHLRSRTDLVSTPAGYSGDGIQFGEPVTALAVTNSDHVVIGTNSGRIYIRRADNLYTVPSGYVGDGINYADPITALAVTSNDNVVIGRGSSWVGVRAATDLTADITPQIFFNGAAINDLAVAGSSTSSWQAPQHQVTLSDGTLQARFQSGLLYDLRNISTGSVLLSVPPTSLDSIIPLFGSSGVNMNSATVSQTDTATTLDTTLSWGDGTTWTLEWSIVSGDLVLQMSAATPQPVDGIYLYITGCDIVNHTLVAADGYGVSHTMDAPFVGAVFGGTVKNAMPWALPQPLVALFEGDGEGWVVDGRDPDLGPSNIRPFGEGQTADLAISKAYPLSLETTTPQLFEVRFRSYQGLWQDGVDPHISWMRDTVGFVPIEQKTYNWIQNIRTQAFTTITDYVGLDALTASVDPAKTYLGRQAEFRNYPFDQGFPDYSVAPTAIPWISQARQAGFHLGVHTNMHGIDWNNTALIEQMAPGLQQIGTDDQGNPIYFGITTHTYCSPAYAPWRAYFIDAIADIVAAGADVIYLDEAGPSGNFVVDGITATQGVMVMEQEIMNAYPGVALQTEGINPVISRHAYFGLVQHPLGHPLSGYILSHFIKIAPEGDMYSPTSLDMLDAFMEYGYILPGSDPSRSESWQQIIDAFQQYNLTANSRLPTGPNQIFGFDGDNGVTAYYEKTATTRSLVIYEPDQNPVEVGVRHTNITQWAGPGYIDNWLIYDLPNMYGLDPSKTYFFDETVSLDPARFHLTSVPAGYLPYENTARRQAPQDRGYNDSFFRVFGSGSGTIAMVVPDAYDVYVDTQAITVDRQTDTATATMSGTQQVPSVVRAFKRIEQPLSGKWVDLPWERPITPLQTIVSQSDSAYPPDGIYTGVAGVGMIIGKFPTAQSIRLVGSYRMRDDAYNSVGDGVVRINGTEVLRVDPGSGPPYTIIPFDVDITSFAGQYAILEFHCDGELHGPDAADWIAPEIVITGVYPGTCAEVIDQGYGIAADINHDCYVNWGDINALMLQFSLCMDPADEDCERPWF